MTNKKSEQDKSLREHEIWERAVAVAKQEPRPEIKTDLPAIRAALWESRKKHTQRVRSLLP
jgi:hypothetical protein